MSIFINNLLKKYIDLGYKDFSIRITNTSNTVLGVRAPNLKKVINYLAKTYDKSVLDKLDFKSHEETTIYFALLPKYYKDEELLDLVIKNLSLHCDSWATTDSIYTGFMKDDLERFYPYIIKMLEHENIWVNRYAIVAVMNEYYDNNRIDYLVKKILDLNKNDYYIVMAKAWLFSVLYIKNKPAIIGYLEDGTISGDLRKKTIRKCLDSYRISKEDKIYLKSLWN